MASLEKSSLQFQNEVDIQRIVATTASPSGGFPLADGATGTSSARMVLGYGSISGYVFANNNGTAFIDQSIDGTTFDVQTAFPIIASVPTIIDVAVYGSQARLRVVNNAGAAQTVYRSNIVARPISGNPNGSTSGGLGTVGAGVCMLDTTTALLANASVDTPVYSVGLPAFGSTITTGNKFSAYDIVRGIALSDVAGTVLVYQAEASADLTAPFTNCTSTSYVVPAGGAGLDFTKVLTGKFILVRFTNGAAGQARMRFFCWLST